MSDAAIDSNGVPTLICASKNDGTTIVRIQVNATNHGLIINDGTTGSDHGVSYAVRDGNFTPVLLATSSADGVTPVEIYADPLTGSILIDST